MRMEPLVEISKREDIFPEYRDTPVGLFLEYHNLGKEFAKHDQPDLLTGMCMDSRIKLNIPDRFSYIIRTGGANLRDVEFNVSYAVAVGGIKYIIVLGHTNCAMINLMSKKDQFVRGLVDTGGWERYLAEEHFLYSEPIYEIKNEIDFVLKETKRLRLKYRKVEVVPMIYRVKTHHVYLIKE
jgi:carbonic anhydrase